MNQDSPDTKSIAAPSLQYLVDALLSRHGSGINSMLFYGSCLRSGNVFDGLVDLYLIVDNYRSFYGNRRQALANWILPPNVLYIELPVGENTLRCKYTVVSSADFERGASRWFETYIWGRFTQPVDVIHCRDEQSRAHINTQLNQCAINFLNKVLPRLPAEGTIEALWRVGLQFSYGVELRAEGKVRAKELIQADHDYYVERFKSAADHLKFDVEIISAADTPRYRADVPTLYRHLSRLSWPLRRIEGKTLSVFRVVKALFTFEGGVDYLIWKLERHSGQTIVISDRVRNYPLIFIWGLLFRLYRRGVFR